LIFGVLGGTFHWRFDSAVSDYVKLNIERWWLKM